VRMFGSSWRLGRIGGVEVRIDTSWVIIAVLIAYSMYLQFTDRQFTQDFGAISTPAAVGLAVIFALLFFGSVLAHELAHALVARTRGIPVRGITLFLFGGATEAKVESKGPKDEFLISVVGPLTSLALGGILIGIAQLGGRTPFLGGLSRLGAVNIALAVFNLLPGFPLDGGRVLRSIVWRATGSLGRATAVASVAGQVVGYLMVGAGFLFVFLGQLFSGIWLAAIGWFLAQAARAQYEQLRMRRVLESVEAEDLMAADLVNLPEDISVREAVDRYFMRHDYSAFPVVDDGSHTVGILTLRAVKRLPQQEWDMRTVRDAMEPIGEQCTVESTARMDGVVSKLEEGDARRCLVLRDGEVVGIITSYDIARWFQRRRALRS
jgi:Zn-dependent protease/predicted transcriptional regulator